MAAAPGMWFSAVQCPQQWQDPTEGRECSLRGSHSTGEAQGRRVRGRNQPVTHRVALETKARGFWQSRAFAGHPHLFKSPACSANLISCEQTPESLALFPVTLWITKPEKITEKSSLHIQKTPKQNTFLSVWPVYVCEEWERRAETEHLSSDCETVPKQNKTQNSIQCASSENEKNQHVKL